MGVRRAGELIPAADAMAQVISEWRMSLWAPLNVDSAVLITALASSA